MDNNNPAQILQEFKTGERTLVPCRVVGVDGIQRSEEREGWEYKASLGQLLRKRNVVLREQSVLDHWYVRFFWPQANHRLRVLEFTLDRIHRALDQWEITWGDMD